MQILLMDIAHELQATTVGLPGGELVVLQEGWAGDVGSDDGRGDILFDSENDDLS